MSKIEAGRIRLDFEQVRLGRFLNDTMRVVSARADDKQIEKRDKTSGEPVQFYVGGSRGLPYEIVVFTVGKDQIAGYLSTPKEGASPAAAAPAAAPAKP